MPSVKNSVGVDNNQLQDQACDPFVMTEQGFKSNLISKICPIGVLHCSFNPRMYKLTLKPIVV